MNATQSIYKIPNSKKNKYHNRPKKLLLNTKLGYVLSVISWKKFGIGDVFLYTDKESLSQITEAGLLELWDKIDSDVLTKYKKEFTGDLEYPNGLWGAPKIEAWRDSLKNNGESIGLDTDLWLLQDFETSFLFPKPPFFLHKDPRGMYPRKNGIPFGPHFPMDVKLDWSVNPQNTALFYFPPGSAREHFFYLFDSFVKDNTVVSKASLTQKERDGLGGWPSVYAEQGLMCQVADLHNLPITTLLSWRNEGPEEFRVTKTQYLFHLWMRKVDVEKWERTKWWNLVNRFKWNRYMKYWGRFLLSICPEGLKFFTKGERRAIFSGSDTRLHRASV